MAKTEQKQRKEGSVTASSCKPQPATKMKRMRKGMPRVSPPQRSSIYRGVTRHRWTGRYEAHLWDKNCWNETQSKKGKQVYLGAYDDEEAAAHAYDLAALKYWGQDTTLNFPVSTYEKEFKEMEAQSKEEYIGYLRRKSSGFSRGVSKFRGVARHHHNGRWEARIGRVLGNKYLYLGTYATQEEAAIAYDMAAIHHRGLNAVTNFDLSRYVDMIKPNEDGKNNLNNDSQLIHNVDGENNPITSLSDEVDNNVVTSPSDEVENNAVTSPSDEVEMNFIDDQQQTSSSTTETPQNLPDSPGGAISSSALELMLHSPKYEEILERTSCFPMKSDSRKSIFPDEIQTYFDCQNPNGYIDGEDDIFGDLNSFVSSMFEFELDV